MSFNGQENHEISFTEAAEFTERYRNQMSAGQIKGGFFGKDALMALLSQSACVGIRFYYGLDSAGKQVMVLVGVDANENDLIGEEFLCMEKAAGCPPICGNGNILNGN